MVTYDVTDVPQILVSKFAPYYLFPDAHYVVGLSSLPGRTKISVGSNPWRAERRTANIANLCGRYGGGGHPAVGAVSLKTDDVALAQSTRRNCRRSSRRRPHGNLRAMTQMRRNLPEKTNTSSIWKSASAPTTTSRCPSSSKKASGAW